VVVCKGDKIKVLRGNFKGHENVVKSVNIKEGKILISGIEVIKKDGTKVPQKVNPSNMLITSLNLEDKKRKLSLERKNE
jgi:large subunit ribosomal protein L24